MRVTKKQTALTVSVPAGRYYLGDPCHVIDADENWMELLESSDYFMDNPIGTLHGYDVLAFGTAHGDGSYQEVGGAGVVGVDAGLIGLVPEELMELGAQPGIGFMVEFDRDVVATTDGVGTLTFGRYKFDTDDWGWDD